MANETTAEVMRRYLLEVVQGHDLEVIPEIASDDMVDHAAELFGWGEGREGLVGHVKYFHRAFPDAQVTIDRLVAGENEVAACWTMTGTHSDDFGGIAATGRQITGTAVSIFQLRDGKIAEYLVIVDTLSMFQQMGMELTAPAEPAAQA